MTLSVGVQVKTLVTEASGTSIAPFMFRDNEIHYLAATSTTLYYRKYNVLTGQLTTVTSWNIENVLIPSGWPLSWITAVLSPDGNVVLGVVYTNPGNGTQQGCVALINLSTLSLTAGAYCNGTSQNGWACGRYLLLDYENGYIHHPFTVYTQGDYYCADGVWSYPSLSYVGTNYLSYGSGSGCPDCECPHAYVVGKCCGYLIAFASDCQYMAAIPPSRPTNAEFPFGVSSSVYWLSVVANEKYIVYLDTSGVLHVITPSSYPNTAFTFSQDCVPLALFGDLLLTTCSIIDLASQSILVKLPIPIAFSGSAGSNSQFVMGNNAIFYDNGNTLNMVQFDPNIVVSMYASGSNIVIKVTRTDGTPLANKRVNVFQETTVSNINIFSSRLIASGTTGPDGTFSFSQSLLQSLMPFYVVVT